jgi:hypothetical protein
VALLAGLSVLVSVLPLLGVESLIVTRPVVCGLVVFVFTRRYSLRPRVAAVAGAAPAVAIVSALLLIDANTGVSLSGRYRLVVWAVLVALYVVAAGFAAMVACIRRRPPS